MNKIFAFLGFIVARVVGYGGRLIVGLAWPLAAPPKGNVAHAMFDANLLFRNTTDSLTATETSSWLTINGTGVDGLCLVMDVPKKSVGDTMQVTIQFSEDGSNVRESYAAAAVASVTEASTVPFKIVRPFKTRFKYVRTVTTVAGTSPDFGVVQSRLGSGDEWNLLTRGNAAPSAPG